MPSNPYTAHIEASLLTAEPIELVRTLYRGALDAVSEARACLATSDAAGRSAAVSKAVNILRELAFSLNPASESQPRLRFHCNICSMCACRLPLPLNCSGWIAPSRNQ